MRLIWATKPPRSLQEKMERFHRHAERWQRIGRIMEEFHPLLQQGRFEQAEKVLDRALAAIEAEPGKPVDFTFPEGPASNLAAGHTVLVVRNQTAFASRFFVRS